MNTIPTHIPVVAYCGIKTFELESAKEILNNHPNTKYVVVKDDDRVIGCVVSEYSLEVSVNEHRTTFLSSFTYNHKHTVIDFEGDNMFVVFSPEAVDLAESLKEDCFEDDFVMVPESVEEVKPEKKSWFGFWY